MNSNMICLRILQKLIHWKLQRKKLMLTLTQRDEGKYPQDFPQTNQEVAEDVNFNRYISISIEDCRNLGGRQHNLSNMRKKEIVDKDINMAINEWTSTQNINETFDNCIHSNGIGGSGKTSVYSTIYYLLKA